MTMKQFLLLAAVLASAAAGADVTVVEESTVDTLVKIHTTHTELTSAEKQRRDSNGKMDGPLGFLAGSIAGSLHTGEIVRLDKDLEWHLEPDKKRYLETLFPTPEERAAAQQKMQATLDKMKQCPAGPAQPKQDPTSGCEKTEPKFNVVRTDETATIAGHPTRKSVVSMTYSCKDVKTGDTCDFVASSELWLAQDTVEGYSERSAFSRAYMKKLGLDSVSGAMQGQVLRAVAPYLDQLKQVSAHGGDLKGTPLRTVFAMSMGGAQCQASKSNTNSNSDAGTGGTPTSVGALGSKLIGGLFGKKSDPAPAQSPPGSSNAPGGPNMTALITLKTEVTSISTATIPAEQFEVPAGWTKVEPKAAKGGDDEFQCPKTGK